MTRATIDDVAPQHRDVAAKLLRLAAVQDLTGHVVFGAEALAAVGQLLGWTRTHRLHAFAALDKAAKAAAYRLVSTWQDRESKLLHSVVQARGLPLCSVRSTHRDYNVEVVGGVPVVHRWMSDYSLPCPLVDVLRACFPPGGHWRVTSSSATPDTAPVPEVRSALTAGLCEELARYRELGCYSFVLAGPPGSGKSTAARQIAATVGGTRMTLSPVAVQGDDVWTLVDVLRPSVLILDDFDRLEPSPALLSRLEDLHSAPWCRSIIATANRAHDLPGALLRPGRCNDRLAGVVTYDGLDAETIAVLTPSLTAEQRGLARAAGLQASYCAQLERDAKAGVVDLESAIEQAAALQLRVGDGYQQKAGVAGRE